MVGNFLGGLTGGVTGGAVVSILVTAQDQASGTLGHVSRSAQKMAAQYRASGMMMIGAAAGITAALGSTVKAAAAEEAGIKRLSQAMANVGISYDSARGSLEAWIDANQQATSFADNEQRAALTSLITMTGDLSKSQDLLTLAMDVSVGTGRDLTGVTTTLGYALAGNWGMVNRMIPALAQAKTEEEKWMMLRQMFAGQAETYGKTMEGQWKTLQNNLGDFKEAIGEVLIPVLMPFVEGLKDMAQALKQVPEPVLRMGVVMAALAAGMLGVRGIIFVMKSFNLALGGVATGLKNVTTGAPGAAAGIGRVGAIAKTTAFQVAGLAAGISMLVMGIMELNRVKGEHAELQALAEAYNADKSVTNAQALLDAMKAGQASGTFKPGAENLAAMESLERYINTNTNALGEAGAAGLDMGADLTGALDESTSAAIQTASAVAGIGAAAQQSGAVSVQSMGAVAQACGRAGEGLLNVLNILSGGMFGEMTGATVGKGGTIYDEGVYMTPDEAYRAALRGEFGATSYSQAWASEAARLYGSGTAVVWDRNYANRNAYPGSEVFKIGTVDGQSLWAVTNPNSEGGSTVFGDRLTSEINQRNMTSALNNASAYGGVPSAPGYATGGWAGLRGPELAWLGEREPELVIPQSKLGAAGRPTIINKIYLDSREISSRVIERVEEDID